MGSTLEQTKSLAALNIASVLALVVITQVIALLITNVNEQSLLEIGYSYAPAGTSSVGSVSNAVLLVIFVFATTLVALFLVRKNKMRLFRLIVFAGTLFALFFLTLLTALNLFSAFLDDRTATLLSMIFALVPVSVLFTAALNPRLTVPHVAVSVILSAEVGSYFASTIPFLTALLIPVAFSLYDIYAVFKGPLRQLVSFAPDNLGISTRVGELTIGVGDTVFYSMLPSLALFQFNPRDALLTMLAVDLGVVLTLRALAKVRLLPGLPIPMVLGLATILLYLRPF